MWNIADRVVCGTFQIEKDPSVMSGLEKFQSVSFTPDGRFVVAGGHGGRVCVWDQATGELVETISDRVHASLGYVMSAAINEGNTTMLVGAMYGTFAFKLFPAQLIVHFTRHAGQVNTIVYTQDAKRAISASADSTVRIWDWQSGQQKRALCQADLDGNDTGGSYANVVAVSKDGMTLISGGSSRLLWVWNTKKFDDPAFVLRGRESPSGARRSRPMATGV